MTLFELSGGLCALLGALAALVHAFAAGYSLAGLVASPVVGFLGGWVIGVLLAHAAVLLAWRSPEAEEDVDAPSSDADRRP